LPLMERIASGAHCGIISASAALLAYLPTHAIGLQQSFWSAITAIAVVQSEVRATRSIARDQFLGAAIGGITGVCLLLALGGHLLVYSLAVAVAMLSCWVLKVPTAARLAGTTVTIILLVPHAGTPASMVASRIIEVGWGVCAAVATVWLTARVPADAHLATSGQAAAAAVDLPARDTLQED
jgi:uncharacterized membrane protein YccC